MSFLLGMILISNYYFSTRELFMDYKTDEKTSWETVRLNIMDKEAFLAVTEEQAIKFFKYD